MAAQQAFDSEPGTTEYTEPFNRLIGVDGTSGIIAAAAGHVRG